MLAALLLLHFFPGTRASTIFVATVFAAKFASANDVEKVASAPSPPFPPFPPSHSLVSAP